MVPTFLLGSLDPSPPSSLHSLPLSESWGGSLLDGCPPKSSPQALEKLSSPDWKLGFFLGQWFIDVNMYQNHLEDASAHALGLTLEFLALEVWAQELTLLGSSQVMLLVWGPPLRTADLEHFSESLEAFLLLPVPVH